MTRGEGEYLRLRFRSAGEEQHERWNVRCLSIRWTNGDFQL